MNEYSLQSAAERAGVEPDFVDRLVELGIVASRAEGRFSRGDTRRISIVNALERSGLPLEGIGEAIKIGALSLDFVDNATYERFATVGSETFRDLSVRTGIPLDLLVVIREAMGSAMPEPNDLVRDDELQVVPLVKLQLEEGFRPTTIERWLRVYGDSVRRIAETEADWYRSEILNPLFQAGKGMAEVAAAIKRLDDPLAQLGDQAVLGLYHGQEANAWMKNIFAGVEAALTQAGLHTRVERVPAICFLDLTGYTRLTQERGDEAAADLAGQLARIVQRSSGLHAGKAVKWLGDGVMFHFADPGQGVVAALEMVTEAAGAGLPPAHVGLHAGPVLFQEGDYFGGTVNVAARIADYARQGEVLVSQEVVDASQGQGITFAEIGPVELKGLSGPVRLYVARRAA